MKSTETDIKNDVRGAAADGAASYSEEDITALGNPGKPQGAAGAEMLMRMNDSHYEVTGWALGFFDFDDDDRVLDIGCGGGLTLGRMAEMFGRGHLTGADYSDVSVRLTTENNRQLVEKGRLEVVEASVEALPFGEGSFDKIITVESFYFWPDPQENLREVRRVLRKGGHFLLVMDIYEKEGLSSHARRNIEDYNLYVPGIAGFRSLFAEAGFAETRVHTCEGQDWICVEGIK